MMKVLKPSISKKQLLALIAKLDFYVEMEDEFELLKKANDWNSVKTFSMTCTLIHHATPEIYKNLALYYINASIKSRAHEHHCLMAVVTTIQRYPEKLSKFTHTELVFLLQWVSNLIVECDYPLYLTKQNISPVFDNLATQLTLRLREERLATGKEVFDFMI